MSNNKRMSAIRLVVNEGTPNYGGVVSFTPQFGTKKMVSIRTLTWTFILMQLVVSCAFFVVSLAIICAKMNSISIFEEKNIVSLDWWIFCVLSFSMIINTIIAMYALSEHNKYMLIPHIVFLILCNILGLRVFYYSINIFDSSDFNCYIGLTSITSVQSFLLFCLVFEIRTFRSMTWLVYFIFRSVQKNITIFHCCFALFIILLSLLSIALLVRNCVRCIIAHFVIHIIISLIFIGKLITAFFIGNLQITIPMIITNISNFCTFFFEIRYFQKLPK
ncbi:unnamed protein product [Caenorhabditis angaria]|uniref:Uncharacterized protein n=1 Tax=Caenorhabditis angaria TaxID=860376 RepID=A0A9P1IAB7_9PELO|nr:unnamed protein product [Caenorhabditis angaria]